MCRCLGRLGCCLVLLILLSGVQAFGQVGLGVGIGGALAFGSSLVVGQTNLPAFILFTPSDSASLQFPQSVTAISINPSCKQAPSAGVACNPTFVDLGVFSIVGNTGTGAAGTSCFGTTFTFTGPDSNGTYTITPGFTIPLASATTCRINFNINVLALPTADCNTPPVAGLQTCAGVTATVTDTTGFIEFGTGEGQPTFPIGCAAQIDKEIVCDGSTNWQDTDFNNTGGTTGCIGTAGSTGVRVRYRINNPTLANTNALPITSCTLTESNAKFGNPTGPTFPINPSSTPSTTFFGLTASPGLECTNARSGGEPNTATLNCTCASPLGPQTASTVTDSAQFECCGVAVDKQVSCGGGPFVDAGFNDGTVGSCATPLNSPVAFRYLAANRSTLPITCSLTDLQQVPFVTIPQGVFATIAAATTVGPVTVTTTSTGSNLTCTADLAAREPDTGSLTCTFQGGNPTALVSQSAACAANAQGVFTLTATDTAQIGCINPPNVSAEKKCIPVEGVSGSFTSSLRVFRTDLNTSISTVTCSATDTFYSTTTGDLNCVTPGSTQPGTTSNVALVPNPILVGTGSSSFATGSITGLQFTACNTATISCSAPGFPSIPVTYTNGTTILTSDVCPVIQEIPGRMTGGGSIFTVGGSVPGANIRVTHGFELHCDARILPNNLEVNVHTPANDRFHLEDLISARCSDDPLIDQRPPVAPIDTYIGYGIGRWNAVSGYSIRFTLVDAGEPGKDDQAVYLVWLDTNGNGVVDGAERPVLNTIVLTDLTFGNHQAHNENK
jgi:hypothetical protein